MLAFTAKVAGVVEKNFQSRSNFNIALQRFTHTLFLRETPLVKRFESLLRNLTKAQGNSPNIVLLCDQSQNNEISNI